MDTKNLMFLLLGAAGVWFLMMQSDKRVVASVEKVVAGEATQMQGAATGGAAGPTQVINSMNYTLMFEAPNSVVARGLSQDYIPLFGFIAARARY